MKNFIKIFFILAYFFTSLAINPVEAVSCGVQKFASQQITAEVSTGRHELDVAPKNNETSFVTSNTRNTEINSFRERKDNFSNGFSDKISAQNRLLQEIFISNYNKSNYSTSHRISPILRNEICTRAP